MTCINSSLQFPRCALPSRHFAGILPFRWNREISPTGICQGGVFIREIREFRDSIPFFAPFAPSRGKSQITIHEPLTTQNRAALILRRSCPFVPNQAKSCHFPFAFPFNKGQSR
jgi:hypothetical protein